MGVEYHAEMVAVEIQTAAGGHQRDGVHAAVEVQIGRPREYYFFKRTAGDGIGGL
ncbi:hypothetical protein D3C76_1187140 [compost metagenome]